MAINLFKEAADKAIFDPDRFNTDQSAIETAVNTNTTAIAAHKAASVLDHPDGSITTAKIKDLAISEPKMENSSVGTRAIADYAVTEVKLALESVSGYILQANSIRGHHIVNGEIGTDELDTQAVTTPKIALQAITENQVADLAITDSKLATDNKIGSLATLNLSSKESVVAAINNLQARSQGTWASWSPTLDWTGTPPSNIVSEFRYITMGKLLYLKGTISCSNGNGATLNSFLIPEFPVKKFPGTSISGVLTTHFNHGATWVPTYFVVSTPNITDSSILDYSSPVWTDGEGVLFAFSGFVELI